MKEDIYFIRVVFLISIITFYISLSYFTNENLWIKFFISFVISGLIKIYLDNLSLKNQIKYVDDKFEIADAELVRVSAIVTELEECIFDLKFKIREIENL
jgi:hypothetical protein